MSIKRKLLILISAMLVCILFVGCGSNNDNTSENSDSVNDKENGKVNEEQTKEEDFNWIKEITTTQNKSESLEKYMRNPEEVKNDKFLCGIEVVDVKTDEQQNQIIYGRVLEPYQLTSGYEEYLDDNIKYIFVKYNPNEFDGFRVLKDDVLAFSGTYVNVHSDEISFGRVEAPMFEANARLNFNDYTYILAMDKFVSSMGQSVDDMQLSKVSEDDAIFNEIISKEEYTYFRESETISCFKDKNGVYWLMNAEGGAAQYDMGVAIYIANKDSDGNCNIEYKNTVQFVDIDF